MADQPTLAERQCEPCRGGVPPLSGPELDAMLAQVPGWTLTDGTRIERRIKCKGFAGALALVNRIGSLAEAEGHHPDIAFGWGYVSVMLQTHAIKGLHANDFIMAAKIGRLLEDPLSEN